MRPDAGSNEASFMPALIIKPTSMASVKVRSWMMPVE